MANIKRFEELSSFLESLEIYFIRQDDKARVPIGLIAGNKQTFLIMNVEDEVSLPDNDSALAERHKMILTIFAK